MATVFVQLLKWAYMYYIERLCASYTELRFFKALKIYLFGILLYDICIETSSYLDVGRVLVALVHRHL